MHDTIDSTPLGLLRCLQALADEAGSLNLDRTRAVLQEAIATCRTESGIARRHIMLLVETARLN